MNITENYVTHRVVNTVLRTNAMTMDDVQKVVTKVGMGRNAIHLVMKHAQTTPAIALAERVPNVLRQTQGYFVEQQVNDLAVKLFSGLAFIFCSFCIVLVWKPYYYFCFSNHLHHGCKLITHLQHYGFINEQGRSF